MMRIIVVSIFLAALVVAGCGNQTRQNTPNDARRDVAQTAAPIAASAAPATAQKSTPTVVFSTSAPAARPAPTASPNQAATDEVGPHLDLPEDDETVVLQGPARTALETALATASGNGPVALPDDASAAVMDSVGSEFRNSCNAVVANWGGSARWVVRILFSLRGSEGTKAVLAMRCASTLNSPDREQFYDERPAIVSITPTAATLRLIPVSARGNGDETLYRLSFSQGFRASGAQLVELDAYHTSDNPCCGGADEESGSRKIILDLMTEKIALSGDERTDSQSHDDSNEDADAETVCESKYNYVRDGIGNVTSIATETRCTGNRKPQPPEFTRQAFTWNAEAHQFVLMK